MHKYTKDVDKLSIARYLNLEGKYDEARALQEEWVKENEYLCERCKCKVHPGWHDSDECDWLAIDSIHES